MTEQEKIRRLATNWMERADESLRSARKLLDERLHADSISRSYYAMFHAVSALLETKRLTTSKHKGVLSLFDLHFVKPRILPKETSAWIHDAFEARLQADYAATAVDPGVAAATLDHAERFLVRIRPVLERLLDELDASPSGNA
jgi:uncharacterized protein